MGARVVERAGGEDSLLESALALLGRFISVSSSGLVAGAQACASKSMDAGKAFSHCVTSGNVMYGEAQRGWMGEKLPSLYPISVGLVQGCGL